MNFLLVSNNCARLSGECTCEGGSCRYQLWSFPLWAGPVWAIPRR